mgnify:CR=1 FL=1
MKSIIMAAGKGTRMKSDLPKVVHLAHGKPMIVRIIDALNALDVEENILVLGHKKEKVLEKYADKIAILHHRELISVSEAVVLFGISKSSIHRLIKQNIIRSVNLGKRLTRINKTELEKLLSPIIINENDKQQKELPKKYKKEDCYTLSQVSEKFSANPSTVNSIIERFNISKEKIGKFVYVPKVEIDKIFIKQ